MTDAANGVDPHTFGAIQRKEGYCMRKRTIREESNPRLKSAFMGIVDNQLKANDPPETKQTLDRLIAQGISREDAKIYIAQAVCVEVFNVLKHKEPSDQARYIRNLQRLPEEPQG